MYIYVAIIVVVLLILLLLVLMLRKRRTASPAAGSKAAQPTAAPAPRSKPAPSPNPFAQAPAASEEPAPVTAAAEPPVMPASSITETPTPAEAEPEAGFQPDLGTEIDDLWPAPKAAPVPEAEALIGPATTLQQLPAPEPELELEPPAEPTAEEASAPAQDAEATAQAVPEASAPVEAPVAVETPAPEAAFDAPDVAEPPAVDFTTQAAETPEPAMEAAEPLKEAGASEPTSEPSSEGKAQEVRMSPDVDTWTPRHTVRPLAQDSARADIRVVPAAVAGAAPLATSAIASLTGLGGQHTPHDDPLRTVVEDIVRGWGDLTEDDLKRLEVFRPEKVLAAVASIGLPKGAKSDYAAKRLSQIKQYAAAQQSKICEDQEAPGEPTSFDGQPDPSAGANPQETAPRPAPLSGVAPDRAAAAGLASSAPALETAPEPKAESAPSLWDVAPAQTAAPKPETAPREGAAPDFGTPGAESAHEGSEFSSMSMVVKTADDIMALPPVERPDFVVFLGPPELAKLFSQTDDQRLKRSVIDILENVGSPASLEVLRTCLDDQDPEIQVYALEAADRLLGG